MVKCTLPADINTCPFCDKDRMNCNNIKIVLLRKIKMVRQLKISILDRDGGTRNTIRNRNK